MAELTPDQKATIATAAGFFARLRGEPRPAVGANPKAGWDAADKLLRSTGGYGKAV